MDFFAIITGLLGGLALFLYGMRTMSEALSRMTGGGLDQTIDKITRTRFLAFLTGTGITAAVQSSSATTVLTVGLVNAGIIKLSQAVGLVIGANLGTTATAWILSLNALQGENFFLTLCKPTSFSPYLAITGIGLLMFARSMKKQNVGTVLIGFAVMMTGMNMMSQAASPLGGIPAFQSALVRFENPFIGFIVALLFTMLIQSSDATVGILQAIAISVPVTGGMALPLVCGAQVGTCVSALISSLGTSNNGKRTALLHLYYNLVKTLSIMIVFYLLHGLIRFDFMTKVARPASIPMMHTFLNLLGAAVYLPIAGIFVKMAEKTIPYSREEEEEKKNTLTVLDPGFLKNPDFAAGQVKQAMRIMAETVKEGYDQFMKIIRVSSGEDKKDRTEEQNELRILCRRIDKYEEQILKYLARIAKRQTETRKEEALQYEQRTCIAFGKIGELMQAIIDIREEMEGKGISFTSRAESDLNIMSEAVFEVLNITIMDLKKGSREITTGIKFCKEAVAGLHAKIHNRHIRRLNGGVCDGKASVAFMDICYDLENIVDACDEIAETIAGYAISSGKAGPVPDSPASEELKAHIMDLYKDKYELLEKTGEE